jgi:tRNA (guanine10-N2)-dimethyltransferase
LFTHISRGRLDFSGRLSEYVPIFQERQSEMEQYAMILGRQPELASAEILSRLRMYGPAGDSWNLRSANNEFLLLEGTPELDISGLFHSLGGSIKLARVIDTRKPGATLDELSEWIYGHLTDVYSGSGKLLYGLSLYGQSIDYDARQLPRGVKDLLGQRGITARFVEPQPKSPRALSSAQVLKTGILKDGQEILVLFEKDRIHLGRTIQVQEFEEFAQRDFGKPSRRIDPGLIPPKLGRMLVNFAGVQSGGAVLEPFCGSGVILVEGLLLGYRMTGIDLSEDAVKASISNLKWLQKQHPDLPECPVFQGDAGCLVSRFGPFAFDAAVAEGDLGPIFTRPPVKKDIIWLVKKYKNLYTTVFAELRSVVRPGGRVVLALPRWIAKDGQETGLGIRPWLRLMGYREVHLFEGFERLVPVSWLEGPMVYHRPRQRTAREIYCFET